MFLVKLIFFLFLFSKNQLFCLLEDKLQTYN